MTPDEKNGPAGNPRDKSDTQDGGPCCRRPLSDRRPAPMRPTLRTPTYTEHARLSQSGAPARSWACDSSSSGPPRGPSFRGVAILPRLIGLAGLCVFAKVAAPLPAYAQKPLVEAKQKASESTANANETQHSTTTDHERTVSRPEASSRDQSSDVETSSNQRASAQRLAQLVVASNQPAGSAEPEGPAAREPARSEAGEDSRSRAAPPGERRRPSPGGRKISLEDEFLIEGKLEKPSAYYILRRSTLDYDWARLDARFSPLVLESVQDPLF